MAPFMRSRLHNQCLYFALKNQISTEAVMWLISCGCLHITDALPMHSFFLSVRVVIQNATAWVMRR